MGRKTRGRQKIEIKKIENEDSRDVCFSKRRMGLFKKASDLAILTAARILVIVFSPAGKAYAFGSPNLEQVVNCFLTGERPSAGQDALEMLHAAIINDLIARYMQLMDAVESAKKIKQQLQKRIATLVAENYLCALLTKTESLGVSEFEQLVFAVHNLKSCTEMKIKEYFANTAATSNTSTAVIPAGNMRFDPGLY